MKVLLSEIKTRSINKFKFIYSFSSSAILGFLSQRKYKNIKTFCLFIGYPRSGHTLIASLLDAHPNIIIGIEWDVLDHVRLGFKRRQIFYSLIRSSNHFMKVGKNSWTGYSYKVNNSWQGKYKILEVIGDKFAGTSTLKLKENPALLTKLETIIKIKPKLIHIIRNPFDIITTETLRRVEYRKINNTPNHLDLLVEIRKFFQRAENIKKLKTDNKYEIYDLYHEKTISEPINSLKNLITFLGLTANNNYLNNCATIINSIPNKSRLKFHWPKELIDFVTNEIHKYEFLRHYNFTN